MGLLAIASLFVIGAAVLLPLTAAFLSARKLYQVPLYWICSAVFIVVLPWVWLPRRPSAVGGEYGGLAYMAELGFSWPSLFLIFGALLAMSLARRESSLAASFSGISWSILLVALLRLILPGV